MGKRFQSKIAGLQERGLAREVRETLVSALYASPFSLAIGALTGTSACALIAYLGNDRLLGLICLMLSVVGAIRLISARNYSVFQESGRDVAGGRAEAIYEAGAWSYSILLGAMSYLTLSRVPDISLHLMALSVTTGFAAAIAIRNAARPVIAIGQIALVMLPASAALASSPRYTDWILACFNLLFVASLIDILFKTYSALAKAFESRHRQEELADQLSRIARIDSLTGLQNRYSFQKHLEDRFKAGFAPEGKKLAMFWIDLDRFKDINDSLGHPTGDRVLREVADRLQKIGGEEGHVARLGGDEFVFLAIVEHQGLAREIAECVIQELAAPIAGENMPRRIGASLGVALAPEDGLTAELLLQHADLALYHAKRAGRGTFRLFGPEMRASFDEERMIEDGLRSALENEEFTLVYQPIVNLKTRKVDRFEALLRWYSPTIGEVSPAKFIPIAEGLGLMQSVDEYVIGQACKEAATWPKGTQVCINVSPLSLKNSFFPFVVLSAIDRSGLSPSQVELEITETVLLDEDELTKGVMIDIRRGGIRLALDDFGTGYSSLSYLARHAFDTVKVDTSFVGGLGGSREAHAIVGAICSLAQRLGMETIAEGVEEEGQLEIVEALGCSGAQGFLFGEPLTSDLAREKAQHSNTSMVLASSIIGAERKRA